MLKSSVASCGCLQLHLQELFHSKKLSDFRHKTENNASVIHGEDVQGVESYKYLGTVFDCKLKFHINTESIAKRGQQRIYLLRKLNSFNVSERILSNFYCSFIESLLTFSFICWFSGLTIKEKNSSE